MRKPINPIARWDLCSNWHATRKNRIYLRWKQLPGKVLGRTTKSQEMRGNTDWEHQMALNLERKATHNHTEAPGQTGCNVTFLIKNTAGELAGELEESETARRAVASSPICLELTTSLVSYSV